MSKTEHTPGPWVIYPETDGTEICAVDMTETLPIRQIIAHPKIGANWIANARLIAAAPDLLAASQCALGHLTGNMDGDMDLGDPLEMLRAAIAKAGDRT